MGLLSGVSNFLFGNDEGDMVRENERKQEELRKRSKAAQMGYIGGLKGPSMSPDMERRLKALSDESQHTSLVEDPYFQKDRATLVQGGQQALSSVQNNQAATGATGGFSNTGSISDVYDRMGSQLADLGQKSANLKDQKSQAVAEARQGLVDAQVAHDNAVTQAKLAIEQGDFAAASAAMNEAFKARQEIERRNSQMLGSLLSAGAAVGGHMIDAGAKSASSVASAASPYSDAMEKVNTGGYSASLEMPTWSAIRRST